MKKKEKENGREALIVELFGSSLPGENKAAELPAGKTGLAARIVHLDALAQADIQEMSDIMAGHPIRRWVTADGCRASVHFPKVMRDQTPEVVARFRVLFFGVHHADICEAFADEFDAAARRYEGQAVAIDGGLVGWVEEETEGVFNGKITKEDEECLY